MADLDIFSVDFCPVDCNWQTEMMCEGKWSDDWKNQLTADFCMPMMNGKCENFCPVECPKDTILCPGHIDPKTGCSMEDICHHGSKYLVF